MIRMIPDSAATRVKNMYVLAKQKCNLKHIFVAYLTIPTIANSETSTITGITKEDSWHG